MFIYKITNTKNNKVYIGKTEKKDPKRRWRDHVLALKQNKHHNLHLQNAWNKYGEESFIHEIITKCCIGLITSLEKYYINKYNSTNFQTGYNKTMGGEGLYGFKHTQETKNKIGLKNLGNTNGKYGKGKKLSIETRIKISKAQSGRKLSETWSQNISNSLKEKYKKMNHPSKNKSRPSYWKPILCLNNNKIYKSLKLKFQLFNLQK